MKLRKRDVPSNGTAGAPKRVGARVFDDSPHDPYARLGKYKEPTRCPMCGAVFHHGHWQWIASPDGAKDVMCPACRRTEESFPAGRVVLSGPYVAAHRGELLQIAQRQAEHARAEHPLHRIIEIVDRGGDVEITTTDVHLPRRIGEALKRAHDGALDIHFSDDAYEIRVAWRR